MAEEKRRLCPEWIKTPHESIGECKQSRGWLCEKNYAEKNYEDCPYFQMAKIRDARQTEVK